MTTLAIVGSGIAGLGCAHFLHQKFDLTVYDPNSYAGGHSNTVELSGDGETVVLDTGFMVFNRVTYPNLLRLFRELQVVSSPTSMSFSVQHRPSGLEYNGSGLTHLFSQPKNLFNLRFIRMLLQVNRFNAEAVQALKEPAYESCTLKQYVEKKGYGEDFLELYLAPMAGAVWSTPRDKTLEFPAVALLRFFHNHGFLGLYTQHPWFTVAGGARSYVERLVRPFREKIRLNSRVVKVIRDNERSGVSDASVSRNSAKGRVKLVLENGETAFYDKVILACHADQALGILENPTDEERGLLSEFKYQPNPTIVHTDASVMPAARKAWASWNYRIEQDGGGQVRGSTHYWMNSLQRVSVRRNYFVTLNDPGKVDPAAILKRIDYDHPVFSVGALRAQQELPFLNRRSDKQSVYFCGGYFRYGFHEDAFTSALDLCRVILKEPLWT